MQPLPFFFDTSKIIKVRFPAVTTYMVYEYCCIVLLNHRFLRKCKHRLCTKGTPKRSSYFRSYLYYFCTALLLQCCCTMLRNCAAVPLCCPVELVCCVVPILFIRHCCAAAVLQSVLYMPLLYSCCSTTRCRAAVCRAVLVR